MEQELNLLNIYSYLTPIAVLLILAELIYCRVSKKNFISFPDAITNIGTAIGNQCFNLVVAFLVAVMFGWLYEYRLFTIKTTVVNFIILLVLFDFIFYWFHRFGHASNLLWAAHMPHHTSEEFNLFVGVRASITQRIFSFTFMWPLALIGFKPEAIYAASAVQLIIAFWHHTRVIKKMPGFETIFNSPSHHRVHHAINTVYLDKNFGEIFIIWDKMFGTFAKEEEEVVFGALTPIQSWNPNKIYVHFWKFLYDDMIATKSWWDKIRLWFMPLGWRPADRRNVYRLRVNEKTIQKFNTEVETTTKFYLMIQLTVGLIIMSYTINLQNALTPLERGYLILALWMMITSWGLLLQKSKSFVLVETVRIMISALIFYQLDLNLGFGYLAMCFIFLIPWKMDRVRVQG